MWFFIKSPPLHSTVTVETVRGCVSSKKDKSHGKAVEVTVNSKEETLKTFVWISSKNSASGQLMSHFFKKHEHSRTVRTRVVQYYNLS